MHSVTRAKWLRSRRKTTIRAKRLTHLRKTATSTKLSPPRSVPSLIGCSDTPGRARLLNTTMESRDLFDGGGSGDGDDGGD